MAGAVDHILSPKFTAYKGPSPVQWYLGIGPLEVTTFKQGHGDDVSMIGLVPLKKILERNKGKKTLKRGPLQIHTPRTSKKRNPH